MFLAGAAQDEAVDAVRPPSLKGALRFWWRALNWSRIRSGVADDTAALRQLHHEESALFGNAAGDSGHQAAVLLHVTSDIHEQYPLGTKKFYDSKDANKGMCYLAGLGVFSFKDGTTRPAVGGTFEVSLRCHPKRSSAEQVAQLRDALIAFGLMGALGARARKGFGSCAIQSLVHDGKEYAPQDEGAVRRWLRQQIPASLGEPPFTALTSLTQVFVVSKTLDQFGSAMTRYRGCTADFNGGDGNFADDAVNALELLQTGSSNQVPRRAAFGLPLQFQFKQAGSRTVIFQPDGYERRASPLFAHFHEFSKGGRLAIFTLIPARFLPDRYVCALPKGGAKTAVGPFQPDYAVIRTFLTDTKYIGAKEIGHE